MACFHRETCPRQAWAWHPKCYNEPGRALKVLVWIVPRDCRACGQRFFWLAAIEDSWSRGVLRQRAQSGQCGVSGRRRGGLRLGLFQGRQQRPQDGAKSSFSDQGVTDMMGASHSQSESDGSISAANNGGSASRPKAANPSAASHRTSLSWSFKALTRAVAEIGSAMWPSALAASQRTCGIGCDSSWMSDGTAGFLRATSASRACFRTAGLALASASINSGIQACVFFEAIALSLFVGGILADPFLLQRSKEAT